VVMRVVGCVGQYASNVADRDVSPALVFYSLQADLGNRTRNGTLDTVFDSVLR
jgi:hypothetical protein